MSDNKRALGRLILPESSLRKHGAGASPNGCGQAGWSGGLPVRHRTAHLGRWLVFAQTLVNHLAQQIVVGPGEFTSATSSGLTQWTRLRTSADPKRLVRGGGTSSGVLSVASGCSRRRPSGS
jgi:hypothetical protein